MILDVANRGTGIELPFSHLEMIYPLFSSVRQQVVPKELPVPMPRVKKRLSASLSDDTTSLTTSSHGGVQPPAASEVVPPSIFCLLYKMF